MGWMAIKVQYGLLLKAPDFVFQLEKELPVVYLVGGFLCVVE